MADLEQKLNELLNDAICKSNIKPDSNSIAIFVKDWLKHNYIKPHNHCEECSRELENGSVFCSADCRIHYHKD